MITGAIIFFAGLVIGWYGKPRANPDDINRFITQKFYSKQAKIIDMKEPIDLV